jgi:hypothetical protein
MKNIYVDGALDCGVHLMPEIQFIFFLVEIK